MKKRILSLLLILCMAVTLLPTAVFAEDGLKMLREHQVLAGRSMLML